MSARRFTAVVTRDISGTITIAPRKKGSRDDADTELFQQVVGVSGALCSTDVRDRRLTVTSRIERMGVASWWIQSLYGEKVFAAALEASRADSPLETTVKAVRTDLSRSFGRLLLTSWMRRWYPATPAASTHEWLLDAEVGALAWDSEELYGSTRTARDLLAPILNPLTTALRRPIESSDESAETLRSTLGHAARAALDAVPFDDPQYAQLDLAEEEFSRHAQTERGSRFSAAAWLREAFASSATRRLAFVAGGASAAEVLAEGALLLDPAAVHPRSAGAARWVVERQSGETWIKISAEVAVGSTDDFFASVFLGDSADTLGVALSVDDGIAEGSARLPDGAIPSAVELLSWTYSAPRSGLPDIDAVHRRATALEEFRDERHRRPARRGRPWGPTAFEDAIQESDAGDAEDDLDDPQYRWTDDDDLAWFLFSEQKRGLSLAHRSTSSTDAPSLVARDAAAGIRAEIRRDGDVWRVQVSVRKTGVAEVFVKFGEGDVRTGRAEIAGFVAVITIPAQPDDAPAAIAIRVRES